MVADLKRVVLFALGGHIATQNASFRALAESLEPKGYSFFGAKDGFAAFKTGEVYPLRAKDIPQYFAGFVAGAGRDTLMGKDGLVDAEKLERANDFLRRGKFGTVVGSGGDDHGMQIDVLNKNLGDVVNCFVINKTMDNDLGAKDGLNGAPHTDFTNGYHTAVKAAVDSIKFHFSGAWTNNCPYLIGLFGRETNWVGLGVSHYGNADLFIPGELPNGVSHSIENIHEAISLAQDKNEKQYGRRFAMVILPEGTSIEGIEHSSARIKDAHNHEKLNPQQLVLGLKETLESKFGMKTQATTITYKMRNSLPSERDLHYAEISSAVIAKAITEGEKGLESTLKIRDSKILAGLAPIELVSRKRHSADYEEHTGRKFFDRATFQLTGEIDRYYEPVLGNLKFSLGDYLPDKMSPIIV